MMSTAGVFYVAYVEGRRREPEKGKGSKYLQGSSMKIIQKELKDNRLLLEVNSTPKEVARAFDTAAKTFLEQMGVTDMPAQSYPKLAEERLGIPNLDSLLSRRVAELLMLLALNEKGITPAYLPKPVAKSDLRRNEPFIFTISVFIKPSYEISSYEPIELTLKSPDVTDAEIDEQVSLTARNLCTFEEIEPRAIKDTDFVMLAIDNAQQGGREIDALNTSERIYQLGAGFMPSAFDAKIIGMRPGEKREIAFEAPNQDGSLEKVECTVTLLNVVKQIVPEVTDEWVRKNLPLFSSVEDLRNNIRDQLASLRLQEDAAHVQDLALQELAKRFTGSIDDEIYQAMHDAQLNQLRSELQQRGLSFEDHVKQMGGPQKFSMMMMVQTRMALVNGYVLDAVYRHAKLKISDDDLTAAAALINPENPRDARQQLEEIGNGFALRETAERNKALQWVIETAKIMYV